MLFLLPYSPFLNPVQWLWRKGKARMRKTFRRPAKSYLRRKVVLVSESLGIIFDPRNILSRNLDELFPT